MGQMALWDDVVGGQVTNVASVPQRSPFRYPGGKTWLVPQIRQWLRSKPYRPKLLIEPFAGGASVGLTVAFEQLADKVLLVERDEQVAAVWDTVINTKNGAEWLAEKIVNFDLTPDVVRGLMATSSRSVRDKAFKTIVQNRISHGGILAEGAGVIKHGENGKGIRSRWYPQTLKKRILDIAAIRSRLKFVRGDAFQELKRFSSNPNAAYFIDPPYTASAKKAGSRLYRYHELNHDLLFETVSRLSGDFLMTYDYADEVRALAVKYRFESRRISMTGTHHAKMSELLIGRNLSWLPQP